MNNVASTEDPNPSSRGFSPLHDAACLEDIHQIRNLLEKGFPVDCSDLHGSSSLMWAASQGRERSVKFLVDCGAYINFQNSCGETPLFKAVENSHISIVQYLAQLGANVNIPNIDGVTPLHIACSMGVTDIVTLLVKYGAFVHAEDDEGDTCLHYAVREGKEDVVLFIVIIAPQLANAANVDGETALDLAVDLNEWKIATILKPFTINLSPTTIIELSRKDGSFVDQQTSSVLPSALKEREFSGKLGKECASSLFTQGITRSAVELHL